MNLSEQQLSSEAIFDGNILRVSVDTVRLPDGQRATREVVRHPGAVAVLAVTEQDEAVLVEQYRYPCARTLLEIPAGKLDVAGEEPAACALRELAEETPYTAQSVELLYRFYTSAGFSDEKMYLFLAKDIYENSTLHADSDEFLHVVKLPRAHVQAALQSGQIIDAKTIIALQYWLAHP
ncbi:MAG: NUDIX hydrolase [Neisseria sp.]|nr:NUDIX hydrolase [Neisseria sp.]